MYLTVLDPCRIPQSQPALYSVELSEKVRNTEKPHDSLSQQEEQPVKYKIQAKYFLNKVLF